MAHVTLQLPSVLAGVLDGRTELTLEASTLREAFGVIRIEHPALAVHLFDETGALRPHVLCFHNDVNTRWRAGSDTPLADGDVLQIVQAVSGG